MYNQLLLSTGGGIISNSQKSPQQGSACVMIGIGGTGLEAVRTLKKAVYQHLEPDDPDADIPQYSRIKFLAIDTDSTEMTRRTSDASDLQPNEYFSLNIPSLGAQLADPAFLDQNPSLDWMSKGQLSMQSAEGAGGIRQVGRYCLFQKANALKMTIQQLIINAKTAAGAQSIYIHIFAGISGGTGSGCFLDTCYIAREAMGTSSGNLFGYFFLPDIQLNRPGIAGNQPVIDYNKLNGYAAFRELDYLMSLKSSGEYFEQSYPGFHVRTQKPPVDLCHLISGTNSKGVIIPNAYKYGMNVVSDYVLSYLAKVAVPQGVAAGNTDGGLTMDGHIANIGQGLAQIHPKYGAERNYHILGASSAELPLTHIGTYLAAKTYAKLKPSMIRHSNDATCQWFAGGMHYSLEGMKALLMDQVVPVPQFNRDGMDMPAALNEDTGNWSQWIPEVYGPFQKWRQDYQGKFKANLRAQSTALDSYDASKLGTVQNPTFAVRLFVTLVSLVMKNSEKYGPTVAAELLSSESSHDLGNVMDGIEATANSAKKAAEANRNLRIQDIIDTAHDYNKAHIGKKKKLDAYLDAITNFGQNEMDIEICQNIIAMVNTFKRLIKEMFANYFSPLRDMLAELAQTFDSNLEYLADPDNLKNESYCWRIFELTDVQEKLDNEVLKPQTEAIEHDALLNYLLDHYKEWKDRDSYRIGLCINNYMQSHFSSTLSTAIDVFLMDKYKTNNPQVLSNEIQADILDQVQSKGTPLFWTTPKYTMDASNTFFNNVLTVPAVSNAVLSASQAVKNSDRKIVVRPSLVSDRITCVNFSSGVPLYAYQGVYELKDIYEGSGSRGTHLHEADINWRETLPTPIPYRWNPAATPKGEEKNAIYEQAVAEKIIAPVSPKYPDEYVVRVLPDTTDLISGYTRDKYYFNGVFKPAAIQADIAQLEAQRAALLPDEVENGYPLKNDGYNNSGANDPSQDFRERVRRDYFIRFGGLQEMAENSLAQLKKIDDKLAELKAWQEEPEKANLKARRFMRLYVLGHFVEQPGKVILTYSYQGIQAEKVLCDPNSKFAGEHSRFQAYLALGEMEQDPKGKEILAHLDQEMEKIFADLQPQWAAPARELAEKYSMSYVNAVGTSTQVLAEHDELVDFYTRLGQQAKKLADMLGTSEAKPVPQPEPEIVISEPTPADTWTCPECGKVCKSNWKICPVCDTPRPEPTDDWTCPECGKVCKAKWKLCPVCDTPKPAGGAQPVRIVPTSWDCPECGKTGLKLKFKACPVCDTPRPAGLEQYLD